MRLIVVLLGTLAMGATCAAPGYTCKHEAKGQGRLLACYPTDDVNQPSTPLFRQKQVETRPAKNVRKPSRKQVDKPAHVDTTATIAGQREQEQKPEIAAPQPLPTPPIELGEPKP